jgi:hypothetical protein
MMTMDGLRLCLYAGIAALVVAFVLLSFVAYANSGSRASLVPTGAVLAALVSVLTYIWFDLQPLKSAVTNIETEFITDKLKPKILQFLYPVANGQRFSDETEANKLLLQTNSDAYGGDGEKLWQDMSLFSVVLYLWNLHDWQIERATIDNMERYTFMSKVDNQNQCTKVEWADIQTQLRTIGNLFAEYTPQLTSLFSYMCLPPASSIAIASGNVLIKTPFCEIRFDVEQLWASKSGFRPGTNGPGAPLLPNGKTRFDTRVGIIKATIAYEWIRASGLLGKYQTWATDLVDRARKWFDAAIPTGHAFLSGDWE